MNIKNSSAQALPDLSKISDREVLMRLAQLARSERRLTHLVLCHLLEVEGRELHWQLGYKSLYEYLNKHLGYSEREAYARIQAAQVLKAAPEISEKLEAGVLNLTQLVQVEQGLKQGKRTGQVVTPGQTQTLLLKIENKSSFETQKIIACELNQAPVAIQKIKPQKDESVRVEITFTQEQFELLKQVQNELSHVIPENDLAAVIAKLSRIYLRKRSGEKKSDKVGQDRPPMRRFNRGSLQKTRREYISVTKRRRVFQMAQHCCEYVNPKTQERCSSRFQLQVDHRHPLARGGSNEPNNLRVLCAVHNRREALRWGLIRPFYD